MRKDDGLLSQPCAETGTHIPSSPGTPEMVERVARAIYEKRNGIGCRAWRSQPQAHRDPYLSDARAAIEAMRRPTSAMVGSVFNAAADLIASDASTPEIMGTVWLGMIDEALVGGS